MSKDNDQNDLWGKPEGIETNKSEGYEFIGPYHEWLKVRPFNVAEKTLLFNKAHFRFWGGSDIAKSDSQAPEICGYRYCPEREYRVLWLGNNKDFHSTTFLRLQSMCLNGIVEGAATCDCGDQFEMAKWIIAEGWKGQRTAGMIILALHHIGKGLGPRNHALIDVMAERVALKRGQNSDPAKIDRWMEPFVRLSGKPEWDELEDMITILKHFGITNIHLVCSTNNPRKIRRLEQEGFIVKWVPLIVPVNKYNRFELETKKKFGHLLEFSEDQGSLDSLR